MLTDHAVVIADIVRVVVVEVVNMIEEIETDVAINNKLYYYFIVI